MRVMMTGRRRSALEMREEYTMLNQPCLAGLRVLRGGFIFKRLLEDYALLKRGAMIEIDRLNG
jgi:hypothetical protein